MRGGKIEFSEMAKCSKNNTMCVKPLKNGKVINDYEFTLEQHEMFDFFNENILTKMTFKGIPITKTMIDNKNFITAGAGSFGFVAILDTGLHKIAIKYIPTSNLDTESVRAETVFPDIVRKKFNNDSLVRFYGYYQNKKFISFDNDLVVGDYNISVSDQVANSLIINISEGGEGDLNNFIEKKLKDVDVNDFFLSFIHFFDIFQKNSRNAGEYFFHNDIKPDNIIYLYNGRSLEFRLIDYGLSDISSKPQVYNNTKGSPLYIYSVTHFREKDEHVLSNLFDYGIIIVTMLYVLLSYNEKTNIHELINKLVDRKPLPDVKGLSEGNKEILKTFVSVYYKIVEKENEFIKKLKPPTTDK